MSKPLLLFIACFLSRDTEAFAPSPRLVASKTSSTVGASRRCPINGLFMSSAASEAALPMPTEGEGAFFTSVIDFFFGFPFVDLYLLWRELVPIGGYIYAEHNMLRIISCIYSSKPDTTCDGGLRSLQQPIYILTLG